jgi:hypothetical protein
MLNIARDMVGSDPLIAAKLDKVIRSRCPKVAIHKVFATFAIAVQFLTEC